MPLFNDPPLYIFIKGNKARQILVKEPLRRLFKPAGLKLIFALLNNPGLANKPYREIAETADCCFGNSWLGHQRYFNSLLKGMVELE